MVNQLTFPRLFIHGCSPTVCVVILHLPFFLFVDDLANWLVGDNPQSTFLNLSQRVLNIVDKLLIKERHGVSFMLKAVQQSVKDDVG